MTADHSTSSSDQAAASKRNKLLGKLLVMGLIVAFTLLRPKVESWLQGNKDQDVAANQAESGQNSGITPNGQLGTLTLDDVAEYKKSSTSPHDSDTTDFLDTIAPGTRTTSTVPNTGTIVTTPVTLPATAPKSTTKTTTRPKPDPKSSSSKPLPKLAAPPTVATKSATKPATGKPTKPVVEKTEPKLGALLLVDRGRKVFKSTAGLLYKEGSADGHRIKHVLKHTEDNMSKPVHGVFATDDRDVVLEWIDRAFVRGQKGGRGVRVEEQGSRVVYTVDMGKKIGYVGGQSGNRKRNPACKYLRLVVQNGNEVVTAYPSQ